MARDDDMMTPDDDASDELVPTWTTDGHLDEGTIHAWIDDAFDAAQASVIAAHVDGCAICRESVAEARGFIAGASRMVRALDAVPLGVVAPADVERVASRIVAAAVADVTRTTAAPARVRRAWYTQPAMRAAAAILVVVGGGTYVWSRTSPMPMAKSRVAAEQSMAQAKPLIEAPKVAAASEPSARSARPVPTASQPMSKKERAETPSANFGTSRPDSARVVASQSVEDRSKVSGAVASERRAFAADAAAPASPPPAPQRAMVDSGARVVSGRITTPSGAPAAGILVMVVGRLTSTTTDSTGAYSLRVVGDSVMLVARQIGYAPSSQAVDLRRRDSARVDLKIERSVTRLTTGMIITNDRPAQKSEALAGSSSIASGVSVTSSGLVQSTIIELRNCWSVQASGTPALRLPTHLSTSYPNGVTLIHTVWFNWPAPREVTNVDMSNIRTGAFTGSSVVGQDTVVLTLTPRGNDWTGLAVQHVGSTRLEQSIVLRRASDSVCKM